MFDARIILFRIGDITGSFLYLEEDIVKRDNRKQSKSLPLEIGVVHLDIGDYAANALPGDVFRRFLPDIEYKTSPNV